MKYVHLEACSILLFLLEKVRGLRSLESCKEKEGTTKEKKKLQLIAAVASTSLPALSTHPAAYPVKPHCLACWKTRRCQCLFCMNRMTKLYYACFKGAAKRGLLLCLHDERVQKEVPALLNPLSNC